MHIAQNKQRLKYIHHILMEMADGNFSYRIPRTEKEDILEKLTVLINWMGEEMKESLFHLGYVNPHHSYRYTIQSIYILNDDGTLNDFSPDVPEYLAMDTKKLIGIEFSKVLEKQSRLPWEGIEQQLTHGELDRTTLLLWFATQKKLKAPAICNVSRLGKKEKIVISAFKAVFNKDAVQKKLIQSHKEIHNPKDIRLIQEVYDYVFAHTEASLPTLRELAKIFGTNEFKLKVGFKYLFKTSIYQLYTNERLNKAYLLIQRTALPLKEIAFICGYNTYPNFSRAFKIKYKCTPNSIMRKSSK